jgi:predicted permease
VDSSEFIKRIWVQQPAGRSLVPFVSNTLSHHAYSAIAAALGDQAQLALYTTQPTVAIGRGDNPRTANVTFATATYFSVLGVQPAIGRWFTNAEADVHSASPVVVVSYAFWRTILSGDTAAIGKRLVIDGRDFNIIGIAAPRFAGADLQKSDLWLPLGMLPTRDVARVSFWDSSIIVFSAIARVPQLGIGRVIEQRATQAYRLAPVTDFAPSQTAQVFLRSLLAARGPGPTPPELSIGTRLAAVAVIVLLIAVANVVNLCLARGVARRRELAVRVALGISRSRLIRLFLIESVALSIAAGLAAVALTGTTSGLLRSLLLPDIQFADHAMNWPVVVFTVSLALGIGLLVGVITAVRSGVGALAVMIRGNQLDALGAPALMPKALVAVQAALSVVLLVGSALFVGSLVSVERLHVGFDVAKIAFASVTLPYGQRPETLDFAVEMRAVGQRVRDLTKAEAVAFARDEPLTSFAKVRLYTATDSSDAPGRPDVTANYVSSAFFNAVGDSLLRGQVFSDGASAVADVVVNQALARAFWPDRDAVGQCVYVQRRGDQCLRVVGVVADAIRERLVERPAPQLYLPIFASIRGQRPPSVLVIRARDADLSLTMRQATSILRAAFPRGVPSVVRMTDRLAHQYRPWRIGAGLFSAFGLLAVIVAGFGVYSCVAYAVTQRVREIGVRIALGATSLVLVRDVVVSWLRPVLFGSAIGIALSLAATRWIAALIFGIGSRNVLTIMFPTLVLIAVAAAAAAIPAWRAAHVDPVQVMAAN